MAAGVVFVLANSVVPHQSVIGATTRDAQTVAIELTRSFGASMPFIVVFDVPVTDIESSLALFQRMLNKRGFKQDDPRGLYAAPVREAVEILLVLARKTTSLPARGGDLPSPRAPVANQNISSDHGHYPSDDLDWNDDLEDFDDEGGGSLSLTSPWSTMLSEADDYYYGLGESLQDYRRAAALYKEAASLGSPLAHFQLGQIYASGEGVRENPVKARSILLDGVVKGSVSCYVLLARLYLADNDIDNATKSLGLFFRNRVAAHIEEREVSFQWWFGLVHILTMWPDVALALPGSVKRGFAECRHELIDQIDKDIERLRNEDRFVTVQIEARYQRARAWLLSL